MQASIPIWDYFEKSTEDLSFAICKKCKVNVSRGSKEVKKMTTSNKKSHLKKVHGEVEYKAFLKTDVENNEAKKRTIEEAELEESPFNIRNKTQKSNFLQRSLGEMSISVPTWKVDDPRSKICHKSILEMIIWDLEAFNVVNKAGWLKMVKVLEPKFQPGSDKFYREMMQKSFASCKERMVKILADADPKDITLILDGWSQFHHGYVGVNIHFIDGKWERKKFNIGCVQLDTSHTGEAMADLVQNLTQEWKVDDKITFVVRDSASNMVRMGNLLGWQHGDCTNHTLQLTIQDELLGMASVEKLVEKCRKVCTYANKSVLFSTDISDAQVLVEGHHPKQLAQDVRTRWNSTFDMMSRFLELKVTAVLAKPKWVEKVEVHFFNQEWELMAKAVFLLKVFKEATLMLSGSQASISQVIPIVKLIRDSLQVGASDHGVKTLKTKLKDALNRRFGEKEDTEEYALATLLDARYKGEFFQDSEKKAAAVQKLLVKLKEASSDDLDVTVIEDQDAAAPVLIVEKEMTIQSLMNKAIEANVRTREASAGQVTAEDILNNYLNAPLEVKKCLTFWKEYEQKAEGNKIMKALARLAKQYLTPPPTSTDVERLFSVAGNILTDDRNRLLPANVEKILFMRENIVNYNYSL